MIRCNNGRSMENTPLSLLFHLYTSTFDNFSSLKFHEIKVQDPQTL